MVILDMRVSKTRFFKFLIIGILLGLAEDLITITFATDAEITLQVLIVVLLVAIPFAAVTEFVVRHPRLWRWTRKKEERFS